MHYSIRILLTLSVFLAGVAVSPPAVSQDCLNIPATQSGDEYLQVEDRTVIVAGPQQKTVTFSRLCDAVLIAQVCPRIKLSPKANELARGCVLESAESLGLRGNLDSLDRDVDLENTFHECRVKVGQDAFARDELFNASVSLRLRPDPSTCGPWCGQP